MSKRAKWKILSIVGVGEQALEIGRRVLSGGDLHHIGGAVAGRELHHAEPVAVGVEPHGLGVDRHRARVGRQVGQVAAVQADGHRRYPESPSLVPRRGLEPPRLAALVPETSASTNSATWALGGTRYSAPSGLSIERPNRRLPGLYSARPRLYCAGTSLFAIPARHA